MKLLIAGGNMEHQQRDANSHPAIADRQTQATLAATNAARPRFLRRAANLPGRRRFQKHKRYKPDAGNARLLAGPWRASTRQVPVVSQNPAPEPSSTPIGVAQTATQGPVTVIHAGTTTPVPLDPGDTISINDTIQTGPGGKASILFDDNTEFTLAENTKLKVDDYVYDPDGNSNKASYRFLEGMFQYVGGLIEKNHPGDVRINTSFVGVGIRGTEFIVKVNPAGNSLEVDLISGAIALTPNGSTAAGPTTSAPAQIEVTPQGTKVLPLTQDQYNTIESQLTPAAPTS